MNIHALFKYEQENEACMDLHHLEELVGTLIRVDSGNETTSLTFTYETTLEVPSHAISEAHLRSLIGTTIGILRIDDRIVVRPYADHGGDVSTSGASCGDGGTHVRRKTIW